MEWVWYMHLKFLYVVPGSPSSCFEELINYVQKYGFYWWTTPGTMGTWNYVQKFGCMYHTHSGPSFSMYGSSIFWGYKHPQPMVVLQQKAGSMFWFLLPCFPFAVQFGSPPLLPSNRQRVDCHFFLGSSCCHCSFLPWSWLLLHPDGLLSLSLPFSSLSASCLLLYCSLWQSLCFKTWPVDYFIFEFFWHDDCHFLSFVFTTSHFLSLSHCETKSILDPTTTAPWYCHHPWMVLVLLLLLLLDLYFLMFL